MKDSSSPEDLRRMLAERMQQIQKQKAPPPPEVPTPKSVRTASGKLTIVSRGELQVIPTPEPKS